LGTGKSAAEKAAQFSPEAAELGTGESALTPEKPPFYAAFKEYITSNINYLD